MPVGPGSGHVLARDRTVGAGAVVDGDGLAEARAEPSGDGAGDRVVGATGRGGHDDREGPLGERPPRGRGGPVVRRCRAGVGEDVLGQVEIALQDLADGAHQRRLRDDDLPVGTPELDLHGDAALGVQHGDVVRAGRPPGAVAGAAVAAAVAGHGAGQGEGGGHPDGAGRGVRGVAPTGGEVARGDAVRVVARADDHGFGDDLVGHVAQPHQPACGAPQRLQPFEQGGVGVELVGGLATGEAEVPGSDDHQRHGGVEAGDLDAVDDVDALPRREDRAGDRAPGVEEVQPDRRRGPGHPVDPRIARVGDLSAGSSHGDVDARAGVDVVDAHGGGAVGGRYQPLLDRERADARQHVAAVGAGVHRPLADPDLGEQVVHVAVGLLGRRDDGHLAGQGAAPADAVELQQVGGADGADQGLIAGALVGGQPLAQEERAAGGACAHQHARHHAVGAGAHGRSTSWSSTRSTMTPAWPR